MKCNGCWTDIEPKTQAVASACGHLFCVKCAQSIVESDGACPVCEALITKKSVRLVTILQDTANCRLNLCGQTPETALNSALASVNFYMKQQELHHQLRESQLKKKLLKVQEQCKQKLAEVHNGYNTAKRKYQEVVEQKRMLEKDNAELRQKYAQKAAQTRKLQEMMKASHPRDVRESNESRQTKRSRHRMFPPTETHDLFKGNSLSPVKGLGDENRVTFHRSGLDEVNCVLPSSKGISGSLGQRGTISGQMPLKRKEDRRPSNRIRDLLNPPEFSRPRDPSPFLSKIGSPDGLASF